MCRVRNRIGCSLAEPLQRAARAQHPIEGHTAEQHIGDSRRGQQPVDHGIRDAIGLQGEIRNRGRDYDGENKPEPSRPHGGLAGDKDGKGRKDERRGGCHGKHMGVSGISFDRGPF